MTDEQLMARYYECDNASFDELQQRNNGLFKAYFGKHGLYDKHAVDEVLQRFWIKIVCTKGSPREYDPSAPPPEEAVPEPQDDEERQVVAELQRSRQFDTARSFRPWAYTLAYRELANLFRDPHVKRTVSLEPDTDDSNPIELPDSGPQPDASLDESELKRALKGCVAALPDRDREIIWHFNEGATLEQIGTIFGRNYLWAFRTKKKALAALEECLERQGFTAAESLPD